MRSLAGRLVAPPGWGAAREVMRLRAAPPARARPSFGIRGSAGADLAGAGLVLGGALALWAAFLAAVW